MPISINQVDRIRRLFAAPGFALPCGAGIRGHASHRAHCVGGLRRSGPVPGSPVSDFAGGGCGRWRGRSRRPGALSRPALRAPHQPPGVQRTRPSDGSSDGHRGSFRSGPRTSGRWVPTGHCPAPVAGRRHSAGDRSAVPSAAATGHDHQAYIVDRRAWRCGQTLLYHRSTSLR